MSSTLTILDPIGPFRRLPETYPHSLVCYAAPANVPAIETLYGDLLNADEANLLLTENVDETQAIISQSGAILLHVDRSEGINGPFFDALAYGPILLFTGDTIDEENAGLLAQLYCPFVVVMEGAVDSADFQMFITALLDAVTGGATIREAIYYAQEVSPATRSHGFTAFPNNTLFEEQETASGSFSKGAGPEAYGPETASGHNDTNHTPPGENGDTSGGKTRAPEEQTDSRSGSAAYEQARRLDAAMPATSYVDQTTEVRAMVALAESNGLRDHLPAVTEEGDLIEQDDAISVPVFVTFNDSDGTVVYIKLEASPADFEIETGERKLPLRPQRDSAVLTFFLTPKRAQRRGRVMVHLYSDAALTDWLGEAVVYTEAIQPAVAGRNVRFAAAAAPESPPWRIGHASFRPAFRPNPLFALAQKIDQYFNMATLRQVCRSLSVDPENLPHQIKFDFAYELCDLFHRYRELPMLLDTLKRFNPTASVNWEAGLDL